LERPAENIALQTNVLLTSLQSYAYQIEALTRRIVVLEAGWSAGTSGSNSSLQSIMRPLVTQRVVIRTTVTFSKIHEVFSIDRASSPSLFNSPAELKRAVDMLKCVEYRYFTGSNSFQWVASPMCDVHEVRTFINGDFKKLLAILERGQDDMSHDQWTTDTILGYEQFTHTLVGKNVTVGAGPTFPVSAAAYIAAATVASKDVIFSIYHNAFPSESMSDIEVQIKPGNEDYLLAMNAIQMLGMIISIVPASAFTSLLVWSEADALFNMSGAQLKALLTNVLKSDVVRTSLHNMLTTTSDTINIKGRVSGIKDGMNYSIYNYLPDDDPWVVSPVTPSGVNTWAGLEIPYGIAGDSNYTQTTVATFGSPIVIEWGPSAFATSAEHNIEIFIPRYDTTVFVTGDGFDGDPVEDVYTFAFMAEPDFTGCNTIGTTTEVHAAFANAWRPTGLVAGNWVTQWS
jgi:hypothetical protein